MIIIPLKQTLLLHQRERERERGSAKLLSSPLPRFHHRHKKHSHTWRKQRSLARSLARSLVTLFLTKSRLGIRWGAPQAVHLPSASPPWWDFSRSVKEASPPDPFARPSSSPPPPLPPQALLHFSVYVPFIIIIIIIIYFYLSFLVEGKPREQCNFFGG